MQMPPKDLPRVPVDQRQVLVRWVNARTCRGRAVLPSEQNSYVPPLLPRQVKLPGPEETQSN